MGEHDNGKGRHNDAVHDHRNILDDGENIARADAAGAAYHPQTADINDQHRRDVEQEHCHRRDHAHRHVRLDDVLRHLMGGVGDAVMLMGFGIKCADHADAAQTFAHNAVLLVDVKVGFFPQRKHLFADQQHRRQNDGNKRQQDQRQHDILAHGQDDAPEKQHWDRRHRACEHGGDPRDRLNVVGRAGDERRRAEGAEFLKGKRVDLSEYIRTQIGAERGDDVGRQLRSCDDRAEADGGDRKHLRAAQRDEAEILILDAVVQNIRHQCRKHQITKR